MKLLNTLFTRSTLYNHLCSHVPSWKLKVHYSSLVDLRQCWWFLFFILFSLLCPQHVLIHPLPLSYTYLLLVSSMLIEIKKHKFFILFNTQKLSFFLTSVNIAYENSLMIFIWLFSIDCKAFKFDWKTIPFFVVVWKFLWKLFGPFLPKKLHYFHSIIGRSASQL